jgi:exonuclease III
MTPRVLDALCSDSSVDLFVLTEYRVPKAGDLVRERLGSSGWPFALHSRTADGAKGIAMYSKSPLEAAPQLIANWRPAGVDLRPHVVAATVESARVAVVGTYVPFPDGALKDALWAALIGCAERHRTTPLAVVGDFNSCHPHEADSGRGYTVEPLERMSEVAVDLWRLAVERPRPRDQITWSGPNGLGNRIDFVFATPPLATRLVDAKHLHELRERKVSDHSMVMVDFKPAARRRTRRASAF